jgi:hypothetical protein
MRGLELLGGAFFSFGARIARQDRAYRRCDELDECFGVGIEKCRNSHQPTANDHADEHRRCPYGKGQGSAPSAMGMFALVGLDNGIVSGLHKFDGPDPAYWCANGYAICNADMRGTCHSEGDSVL